MRDFLLGNGEWRGTFIHIMALSISGQYVWCYVLRIGYNQANQILDTRISVLRLSVKRKEFSLNFVLLDCLDLFGFFKIIKVTTKNYKGYYLTPKMA